MVATGWTISDNVFLGIRGRTGSARGAVFLWQDTRDCVVERNVVVDCDSGICLGNSFKPPEVAVHCTGIVVRCFVTRASRERHPGRLHAGLRHPPQHGPRPRQPVRASDPARARQRRPEGGEQPAQRAGAAGGDDEPEHAPEQPQPRHDGCIRRPGQGESPPHGRGDRGDRPGEAAGGGHGRHRPEAPRLAPGSRRPAIRRARITTADRRSSFALMNGKTRSQFSEEGHDPDPHRPTTSPVRPEALSGARPGWVAARGPEFDEAGLGHEGAGRRGPRPGGPGGPTRPAGGAGRTGSDRRPRGPTSGARRPGAAPRGLSGQSPIGARRSTGRAESGTPRPAALGGRPSGGSTARARRRSGEG